MYLPHFKDFIAVGQSHYVRYPSENLDTQKPSPSCEQNSSSALNSKSQGVLSIRTVHHSVPVDPWFSSEPQNVPVPHVPSICVTPPDTITTEPANHTTESKETEGQGFNSDDQYHIRSCEREIPYVTGAESGSEALMDRLGHYAERVTKDYDAWLKLAQGTNPCEDGVAAGGKAGPSIASPDACHELVLWKPMPFATKPRDCERKFSLGRRFSLNQSVIYPFRTKRNSV